MCIIDFIWKKLKRIEHRATTQTTNGMFFVVRLFGLLTTIVYHFATRSILNV